MTDQFELSKKQSHILLDFAGVKKNDIFFDLGCGKGNVVREAIKYGNVGLAVGIEFELEYYEHARKKAINYFGKENLKKTDFWLGRFDSEETTEGKYIFDLKESSVVYYSLEESKEDMLFFKTRLQNNVKLIKKDLPLIGYDSVSNKVDRNCWFFLMRFPTKRIRSLKKWIKSVDDSFETIDDLYNYYYNQLQKRYGRLGWTKKEAKNDAKKSITDLKKLIAIRF